MEDENHATNQPEVEHVGVEDEEYGHAVMQAVFIELGAAVYVSSKDVGYQGVQMVS